MDPSVHQPPFATTALIYVVAVAIFMWRLIRPQRTSVVRLAVVSVILLVITAFSIYANAIASAFQGAPAAPAWEIAAVIAIGAVLGIPLGILRGRHSEVKATDKPGVLYIHSSPFIIAIWLVAFLARAAIRAFMPHAGGSAGVWSDGLLAFAMAALITSYYAIYLKYKALPQQPRPA